MNSTDDTQDEGYLNSDNSGNNKSPHPNDTSLDDISELQSLDNHPGDITKDNGAISESQPMEGVLAFSESINSQNNVRSSPGSPCIMSEETLPIGHDTVSLEEPKTGGDIPEATVPLLASSPSSPSTALTNPTSLSPTTIPIPTQPSTENNDVFLSDNSCTPLPLSSNTNSETYSKATMEVSMVPDDSMVGRRRSSVAAVAHSLLGDKLDDFTEKLAYIRKNIIMSLDDDDEDDDDYSEDNIKSAQPHHHQLRRSRSGSMRR